MLGPDIFNFNVDLAGHDMVTDAGNSTTCRRKRNPLDYKQNVQKQKDLPKTWVLKGTQFEDVNQKKNRTIIFDLSKTPVGHQYPTAIKGMSPSKT